MSQRFAWDANSAHRAWLLAILALALGLRSWDLGSLSFWYDEVVSMRLAETHHPTALLVRLDEIDATRAPLHPLLLQGWIRVFGPSEASSRSLSVLFGVAAVGFVYAIGRLVFDPSTGLWAGWLASISPLMVYYSREARMYSMLVLVTCVCWAMLFSLRLNGERPGVRTLAYVLGVTAIIYTHPLGLLMAAGLAAGSWLGSLPAFGSRGRWLLVHATTLVLVVPWIGRYVDHAPEFVTGRLPLKFLLGTPIGFLGGNALVLLVLVAVAVIGLVARRRRGKPAGRPDVACLLIWLCVPPVILYGYSLVASPIFGPSRYTLFVAPAYLILVAQGLARLPRLARLLAATLLSVLAGQSLATTVYAPGLKADWRGFSSFLETSIRHSPGEEILVFVASPDPASGRNVEVETARYYLPARCRVLGAEHAPPEIDTQPARGVDYLAVGFKGAAARSPAPPDDSWVLERRFPGLAVFRPRDP